MGKLGKTSALILIFVMTISSGSLIGFLPEALAQSGTNVSYIISSDTTWTQANSPYNFTGNVLVSQGVTLTIGADATVDLNNYYLEVNGTLLIQSGATINIKLTNDGIDVYGTMSAEGTSANPIHINGSVQGSFTPLFYSAVTFFPSSISWSPQTNSGSLVENTVFNDIDLVVQSGVEISGNTFLSGSLTVESASPTILNNAIVVPLDVVQNPNVPSNDMQPEILNNSIGGGLVVESGEGTVADNVISGLLVNDEGGRVSTLIELNVITGAATGIGCGIINSDNNGVIIENNTVTNNSVGVGIGSPNVPAITNNNIYNNSYNAETFVSVQTSLPDNWWGTTNTQAINQSIYDFKDDFNLGTVNFVPFLTAPNPQAPVFLAPAPTSTPTPSASPTPAPSQNAPTQSITISTPTVPELSWLVIVPLFLSVFSVAVIVRHRKTANSSKQTLSRIAVGSLQSTPKEFREGISGRD